jgi:hypothetical protein
MASFPGLRLELSASDRLGRRLEELLLLVVEPPHLDGTGRFPAERAGEPLKSWVHEGKAGEFLDLLD